MGPRTDPRTNVTPQNRTELPTRVVIRFHSCPWPIRRRLPSRIPHKLDLPPSSSPNRFTSVVPYVRLARRRQGGEGGRSSTFGSVRFGSVFFRCFFGVLGVVFVCVFCFLRGVLEGLLCL